MLSSEENAAKMRKQEIGSIFASQVAEFAKKRKGSLIEQNNNSMKFMYLLSVDEFETKRILISWQQRKNSFKVSVEGKARTQMILGGALSIKNIIERLNSQSVDQITCYMLNEPNIISARLIIEKDNIYEINQGSLRNWMYKILEATDSNLKNIFMKVQLQQNDQNFNSRKLKEVLELVNTCKIYLQAQISKRSKIYHEQKQFAFSNNFNMNPFLYEQTNKFSSEQQYSKLLICLRKIKQDQIKYQTTIKSKTLLNKIKLIRDLPEDGWFSPKSSYGIIQKIRVQFLILQSFNNQTTQILSKLNPSKQKIEDKFLIRKSYIKNPNCINCYQQKNKNCGCLQSMLSFQNQVIILMYIRNIITESIAEYYVQDNKMQLGNITNLYSQFYEGCMDNYKPKTKDFIPFFLNLMDGLKIMGNSYVIHRDMKPSNVMLDPKKFPKIIDFGSAYELKNLLTTERTNSQLVTTKRYNLFYDEAVFPSKHLLTQKQYETHELYDVHAFGVMLRDFFSDQGLASELGNLLVPNLNWLSVRCCSMDPNMRLNHAEIMYFLTFLQRLWVLKMAQSL